MIRPKALASHSSLVVAALSALTVHCSSDKASGNLPNANNPLAPEDRNARSEGSSGADDSMANSMTGASTSDSATTNGAASESPDSLDGNADETPPEAEQQRLDGEELSGSSGEPSPEGEGLPQAPAPACARSLTDANKATVTAAIDELFVQGDLGAVDRYWGEPYLQHNPIAESGVETFRNLFSNAISPGNPIYELSRVAGECELVLIHGNYATFGGPTFDMFRVKEGRIVEHWDAPAIGAGPNASGHTALDGETQVSDPGLSAENEATVLSFVQRVLIEEDYAAVDEYVSPTLIEHNPQSTDGSANYVRYLQDNAIAYRQVHHSIGDGNFVFVLSEGSVQGTDVAHYDLFRVDSGQIVERWDGRRSVPDTTASGLGIF